METKKSFDGRYPNVKNKSSMQRQKEADPNLLNLETKQQSKNIIVSLLI